MSEAREERRRQRLEERLRRMLGEGAAAFYRDALSLATSDFASRGLMLGSLTREIDSAMLQAMSPLVGPRPPRDQDDGPRTTRRARAEAITAALGLDPEDRDVAAWIAASYHTGAHRGGLGPPRDPDLTVLTAYEAFLGKALDSLEARYGAVLRKLDEMLSDGPRAGAALLCDLPAGSQAVALKHFFDRASADWLSSLPKCVRLTAPYAEFLAKVAPENPNKVIECIDWVLSGAPADPIVHADLAFAASQLPGPLAARWAYAEVDWIRRQSWLVPLMVLRSVEAANALLDASESSSALAVASALLASGGPAGASRSSLGIRMPDHAYEDVLESLLPGLASATPRELVEVLIPLVAELAANNEKSIARSSFWMRTLRDEHDERDDIATLLVGGLRDAAWSLAAVDGLPAALERLARVESASNIFRRIALHLIARARDVPSAVAWLEDPAIEGVDFSRDVYELVFNLRSDVPVGDRERILTAIDAGAISKGVKLEVRHILDPAGVAEASFNEALGMPWTIGNVSRPSSPLTVEELSDMSVEAMVEFVTAWGPDDPWEKGDLGPVVQAAVAADPNRYVADAARVLRLPPDALPSVLWAFRESAKTDVVADWSPLMRALRDHIESTDSWRTDGWQSARSSLASFVVEVLARHPAALKGEAREDVWWLITELALESEPASQGDTEGRPEDLLIRMLNAIRPTAVRAAIYYARWVQNAAEGHLPAEVREFLDAHADPSREESSAVRAGFGWDLPMLVGLDPDWVVDRLDWLFPQGEAALAQRRFVWDAYVNTPYRLRVKTLLTLRREWERWADGLAAVTRETDERAAEQVLVHYWHGQIDLTDPILVKMIANIPPPVRSELITWVGWQLWQSRAEPLEPDVETRIRALWDAWTASRRATDHELGKFGRWFASGDLDLTWSLDELERLLAADVPIDDLSDVVVRLADSVNDDPVRIGRIGDLLVSHEMNREKLDLAQDEIAALVANLVANDQQPAQELGHAIESRMQSHGLLDSGPDRPRRPRRRRR